MLQERNQGELAKCGLKAGRHIRMIPALVKQISRYTHASLGGLWLAVIIRGETLLNSSLSSHSGPFIHCLYLLERIVSRN